jgi:hypothetical protein
VLACGEGAVLSHQTAASVWDLRHVGSGAIHVTVPGDPGRRKRPGIRIHRSTTLTAADTTRVRGLPVTTPARTIIDLARTLNEHELEAVVDRADDRHLVDFRELRAARSASLQAVLRAYAPGPTRSALERGLLTLYRYHRSPQKFESDREQDVVLSTKQAAVGRGYDAEGVISACAAVESCRITSACADAGASAGTGDRCARWSASCAPCTVIVRMLSAAWAWTSM